MPRINITSVMVDDQDKALAFYTEKLGFVTRNDVPVGEFRWLTASTNPGASSCCWNLTRILRRRHSAT